MIIGKKTILKKFLISDINSVYISWLNNKKLLRYSNNRFNQHTRKNLKNFYLKMQRKNKLFLKILTINENKFIGTMTAYINPYHRHANIGILIGNNKFSKRGYGRSVVGI